MAKLPKAIVTKQRSIHTYSELWKASRCALEVGIREPMGSSCQFLSSLVLTAFTFEAYLNHVGPTIVDRWPEIEKQALWDKFDHLCIALNVSFPDGKAKRPLQTICKLIKFRNAMAHGRSEIVKEKPEPREPNERLVAHLRESPLADWQRLIQTKNFAERARDDLKVVLNKLHAARPEPRGRLFSFGLGIHLATVPTGCKSSFNDYQAN